MICFATCMFGVEALVRDELIMLGAKNVRAQDARVFFEADRALIIKANLWLRCADRVFVQLGTCKAKTFVCVPWIGGICCRQMRRLESRGKARFPSWGLCEMYSLSAKKPLRML